MTYNLFWWCHHFCIKNGLFAKKEKNTLSWAIFLEGFFVAPLFLDICIEVFGAWVNHKNISNSDIFKEDTAVFAKMVFKHKQFVMENTFIINLLS